MIRPRKYPFVSLCPCTTAAVWSLPKGVVGRDVSVSSMKCLWFIAFVLIVAGCQSRDQSTPPRLGEKFEINGPKKLRMIASAQLSPFTEITRGGVKYTVAVDKSGKAIYIDCADKSFRTPEGLGPDATLVQVLSAGGSAVVEEPGWAYYSVLPSGWHALFYGFRVDGEKVEFEPAPVSTTKVNMYFQRK
jgi:hypothetical protein